MEVSMDGLRRRMIADHNSLVRKLNNSVKDSSFDPHIIIDPESIRGELDGLRNAIITLAFSSVGGVFKELPEDIVFENFFETEENEEDMM